MLKSKNNFENILIFFFSIFPVSFLIGNLFINLSIIIISTIYLVGIFLKKIKFKVNDKFFILLLFFFITLVINLIFTNNISLSYPRVIKFIFSFPSDAKTFSLPLKSPFLRLTAQPSPTSQGVFSVVIS